MRSYKNILGKIDWSIVLLYLILIFVGWINIYAAVYNEDHHSIFDISQRYGKQLMWIGLALVIAFVILLVDSQFFTSFAIPIYAIVLLSLVGVLLFGVETNGARSWFKLGGFKLQPSEFAKFATSLALAKYLSALNIKMKDVKTKVLAAVIIGLPAVLILLQNDTGSTLVYAAFIFVLYREGLSGNILLFGILAILVFVLTLIFGPVNIILTAAFAYIIIYGLLKYDVKTTFIALVAYSGLVYAFFYFELISNILYYSIAGGLFFLVVYLITRKEMRDKSIHYIGVVIFVLTCFYIFSIDFAFNKVLKEHQRTRITVLLGEEEKLVEQIETLKIARDAEGISKEEKQKIRDDIGAKRFSLRELRQGNGWNITQLIVTNNEDYLGVIHLHDLLKEGIV